MIINMPQDATYIDTYYAKLLCKISYLNGGELQVFFIRNEDKVELLNKVYKREPKRLTPLTLVKIRLHYSARTLLYSWGCADYGKLGISNKLKDLIGNR